MFIHVIVLANGIYDIICALSIVNIIPSPQISSLHLSIFRTPLDRSLLATWIAINGIIRTLQYCYQTNETNCLVQLSYLLEAGIFSIELLLKNVVEIKALFVIASSLLLAYMTTPPMRLRSIE